MRVLVGIPVFRVKDLTRIALNSVVNTPADLLIVDNAADQDIKDLISQEFSKAITIVSTTNEYCNGGWNRAMKYGLENGYDIIGLGSSDVQFHPGWYALLQERAAVYSDEVWVPKVGPYISSPNTYDVDHPTGGVAGFYTFLPRKAVELVYPIPAEYKHWFGDQYMYEKLRANGWKVTIMNCMTANHQQSAITFATPEAYVQIERDIAAWNSAVPPSKITDRPSNQYITTRESTGKPGRWHLVKRKI
jgi:hypothetical protein